MHTGRVFNGSTTYQNVGIDISNVAFYSFVISGCTSVNVIIGTNSSNMLVNYYRFAISPISAAGLYVT